MKPSLKRKAIEEYVISARRERDIRKVDRTIKPEVSGIMQGPDGDIESLVERELLPQKLEPERGLNLKTQRSWMPFFE